MGKPLSTRVRERLRSWRRRLRGVPRVPDWVQLEINNDCNLNCVMCPRQAMRRPPRLMSLGEIRKLTDQVAAAGVPRLRLFFLGEPLLHPELAEGVRYAKARGVASVELNTNAALLTPERSRDLIAAGLDEIVFSLDGADAESYERIRRGARYDQVVANVEAFFRLRRESGQARPHAVIQTILMKPTAPDMASFVQRWQPVADLVRVAALREYHGVEGLSLCAGMTDDELRPCPALWSYLVVLSDLRVTPCCTDINGELCLGDARETALMSIWRRGARLQELRRSHLALEFSRLPLCACCEFISLDLLRRKTAATSEWSGAGTEAG